MSSFDFNFSRDGGARKRPDDVPLRILIIADLERTGADELAPVAVDIDNLDAVFGRLAPRLRWGDADLVLREPDDLHPDGLCARVPALQALLELRRRLQDPDAFAAAAAELQELLGSAPATAPADDEPAPPADEHEGDMFARLLGERPARDPRPTPDRTVDRLIGAAVQGHIAAPPPTGLDACLAAVDQALTQTLQEILRDPRFQTQEAAWLGLRRLLGAIEDDGQVQIGLLPASPERLRRALTEDAADLARKLGPDGDGAPSWSLLVLLYRFGAADEDLAMLAGLAGLARQLGAPLLADAQPALAGADSLAALGDPSGWHDAPGAWAALRRDELARWIGLLIPPPLLRLPYGAATDPIDAFDFEEWAVPGDPLPAAYAGLGAAELIVRAFTRSGWAFAAEDELTLADLPAHSYRTNGDVQATPATFVRLGETALDALLGRGLMPLAGHVHGHQARLVRFQSAAEPPTALPGPWRN